MAVDFDVKGSRTSEYGYLPEQLDVDPALNGRHELPDISALIESIVSRGQLQPVTIRKAAGKPVLVAGFSRWRAVTEINKQRPVGESRIQLRCSYTQLSEQQAFIANIEENRVRNATLPIDDAHNIQRLINVYQMSVEDAAQVYRASVSWVRSTLTLIELTPEAEKAVRSGRVKGPAAKAIAKLSKEHQQRIVAQPGPITTATVRKDNASGDACSASPGLRHAVRPNPHPCDTALKVWSPAQICDLTQPACDAIV